MAAPIRLHSSTSARSSFESAGDALTERILQLASRQGLFQRDVAERAGIRPTTFYDRVRFGNWNEVELRAIASGLDLALDDVLDVSEVL